MSRRKQPKGKPVSEGIRRAARRAGIEPTSYPSLLTPAQNASMLARELRDLANKLLEAPDNVIGSTVEGSGAEDTLEALAEIWSVRQCLVGWASRIAAGEFHGQLGGAS